SALHLHCHDVGIDGETAVHRADDLGELQATADAFELRHLGDIRIEGLMYRDAPDLIARARSVPAGLRGRKFEYAEMPRLVVQQRLAECVRVALGVACNIVDETFGRKRGMR